MFVKHKCSRDGHSFLTRPITTRQYNLNAVENEIKHHTINQSIYRNPSLSLSLKVGIMWRNCMKFVYGKVQNIVGKEENACYHNVFESLLCQARIVWVRVNR